MQFRKSRPLLAFTCLVIGCGRLGQAQVNVLTANGGNDRANANLQETQLQPGRVTPGAFGKIGSLPVDGQVYSQVLYASALELPGSGSHNVLFVSTMHNSVYAFDADAAAPSNLLWRTSLGDPVPSAVLFGSYSDISPEIGILGTGAIDLDQSVLYVVAETLQSGAPQFTIHALDLATGSERLNGPALITAASSGIPFDPRQHLQRPGLLVANHAVYVAFGSHADMSPWHGWLFSYNGADLSQQTGVFLATPSGDGGAIWQSGRGLAADDLGNVYAMTGNGPYDGAQNFSQSVIKFSGSGLAPADWFTPSNWQSLSDYDGDLSAGPALIAGTHTVIGADKYGNFYVINGDSMGHLSDNQTYAGVSQGYVFNFAVWSRPDGAYVYTQGGNEPLECFSVTADGLNPSPVSVSSTTAAITRVGLTVSADGATDGSGIVWEVTGEATGPSVRGTLHAFDASNLQNELWNSEMYPLQDTLGGFQKFVNPTVVNGKVYVPNSDNSVVVYGLLPADSTGQQSITVPRNRTPPY